MSNGVNGYNWSNASYRALYTQINTNSGALNKEEGIDEDELKRSGYYDETAFKEADTDNSGVLSAAEFEKYMALYNASTIAPTGTTGTTVTDSTTTTIDISDIMEYDKVEKGGDGNGQIDTNELINYLNDLNSTIPTYTTIPQTTTEVVDDTETTVPETGVNAAVTARITEISKYITEAATNTSTELGMYIALEFVGENKALITDVVKALQLAAADYMNANPDNTNAVTDFRKQLIEKYNEVKVGILEASPARTKEIAVDTAYQDILDAVSLDTTKEDLYASITKELKKQLLTEANRYAGLYDGDKTDRDTFCSALVEHLDNYFTVRNSEILEPAIEKYNNAVEGLSNVIGQDNDFGTLRIASMKFLQEAVKEGITVKVDGQTVTDSNIFSIITKFTNQDTLKAAMDACIAAIEGDAKINTIVKNCLDDATKKILTSDSFDKNVSTADSYLKNLETQIGYLSETSSNLTKAETARDTINELLWSDYEREDEEGNVIKTYENGGKLAYILDLLEETLDKISREVGEDSDKYTAAVEEYNRLKGAVDEIKGSNEYRQDALDAAYNKVVYNDFVDNVAKKAKSTSSSIVTQGQPAEITTDNTRYKNSQDSTKRSIIFEVTNDAYSYLSTNTFKNAMAAPLLDKIEQLTEAGYADEAAKLNTIISNSMNDAIRKAVSSSMYTDTSTELAKYYFNYKTLINNFMKEFRTAIAANLSEFYKEPTKEGALDKNLRLQDIDYMTLFESCTEDDDVELTLVRSSYLNTSINVPSDNSKVSAIEGKAMTNLKSLVEQHAKESLVRNGIANNTTTLPADFVTKFNSMWDQAILTMLATVEYNVYNRITLALEKFQEVFEEQLAVWKEAVSD